MSSESTIAVMGELENALFEDWDESSSLHSVSDSVDLASMSSSSAVPSSSAGSSLSVVVGEPEVDTSSASTAFFSGWSLLGEEEDAVAVTPSVLAVAVLSEAGEAGDLSSLKPLSSDRI